MSLVESKVTVRGMPQVDGVVTIEGSTLVDDVFTVGGTLTVERWPFSKSSSLIFRK